MGFRQLILLSVEVLRCIQAKPNETTVAKELRATPTMTPLRAGRHNRCHAQPPRETLMALPPMDVAEPAFSPAKSLRG
jgi:hypothetical protein